jgi:hypothetical protein
MRTYNYIEMQYTIPETIIAVAPEETGLLQDEQVKQINN